MKGDKTKLIKEYLERFPNTANNTLAKKIYKEHPLEFKNSESVRDVIRSLKGAHGKRMRNRKDETFFTEEAKKKKYNLPQSIHTEYEPYILTGKKGLIFGDVHIPFHDINALETMFDYTVDKNLDFILINGDLMDCFDISYFSHEPDVIRIKEERDMTKEFLIELKKIYPNTKIYYKFANHESRWEKYLINKAPEIFDFTEFRLNILLDLFNIGIEYIEQDKYIKLHDLNIIHGHEYKNAVSSPANAARTLFLRSKENCLTAHFHQTSEHTETTIKGDTITCWSIGCLCELHPKYMSLNKWNLGFALYERYQDGFWHVDNKRIIQGHVV